MREEETAPLETLRERLYTNTPLEQVPQTTLHADVPTPSSPWQPEPKKELPKPHLSWAVRFLIGAALFFVIAGGVTAYLVFGGSRSVSSARIEITTAGPLTIASGDTVPLLITIRNNNPTPITKTSIVVTLPADTREVGDTSKQLQTYTDTLGDIPSGGEVTRTVTAVVFGAQNQVLTIPIRIEYRTEGSNALFTKEAQYSVTVTTSPIRIEVSSISETTSGQTFTQVLTVRSNSTTPLERVGVSATYPYGFIPSETRPQPTSGTFWNLGTLAPGEQKMITIKGSLSGQQSDERAFIYSAGTVRDDGTSGLGLTYTTTATSISIRKPFLSTALSLNRDTSDMLVVPVDVPVDALLSWQNSLPVPISDAQITIAFDGAGLDKTSIHSQSGFYRSSDTTLLFSKDTNPALSYLGAGDTGTGSFSFSPKDASALSSERNPTITLTISIAGKRLGEGNVPETITSSVTRTLQVATDLVLSSRIVHASGPFTNTGPLPPIPDKETTYTVLLEATNTINPIRGGRVIMTLPSYVRFTGKISPTTSALIYDETTRTVTWQVGDIAASEVEKTAFQVALLPSASQSGTSPTVVSGQTFEGIDEFTKKQVTTRASALSTQLKTDPSYNGSFGTVGK
jgi:hypothetical protein